MSYIKNLRSHFDRWRLNRWVRKQERNYRGIGKFARAQHERIYLATLDGACETFGDVQGEGHFSLLEDFEGSHWIVAEDTFGFVDVEQFDSLNDARSTFDLYQAENNWGVEWDDEDWEDEPPNECPQCRSTEHTNALTCDLLSIERVLAEVQVDPEFLHQLANEEKEIES